MAERADGIAAGGSGEWATDGAAQGLVEGAPVDIDEHHHAERAAGVRTATQGLIAIVGGVVLLWALLAWFGQTRAVFGALPLFGGAAVGYGGVQALFGARVRWLRWFAAVVIGFLTLGATVVVLESLVGAVFV